MKKFIVLSFLISAIVPSITFAQQPYIISNAFCTALSTNLSYGNREINGNSVSTLQVFLSTKGYLNSQPTGYFGVLTFAAVKKYQTANGISPTGFVGPITRAQIKTQTCSTSSVVPVVANQNSTSGCSVGALFNTQTGASCTTPTNQPSITILSPNGGEVLANGQSYRIKWNSEGVDKVSIAYKTCDSCVDFIVSDIANTGYYDWNVNVIGNTTQYKIYIIGYHTGVGSNTDVSDNFFTVTSPTLPFDFSISHPDVEVVKSPNIPGSGEGIVRLNLLTGIPRPVEITRISLPAWWSATGVGEPSCVPTCSQTHTYYIPSATLPGTYDASITAVGGPAAHTATFKFVVKSNPQQPPTSTPGCPPGALYDITTGAPCTTTPTQPQTSVVSITPSQATITSKDPYTFTLGFPSNVTDATVSVSCPSGVGGRSCNTRELHVTGASSWQLIMLYNLNATNQQVTVTYNVLTPQGNTSAQALVTVQPIPR